MSEFKSCSCCNGLLPIAKFRLKTVKTKAGNPCTYRDGQCDDCRKRLSIEYYVRKKMGITAPVGRPKVLKYWRDDIEAACDQAMNGWPLVAREPYSGDSWRIAA